MLMLKIMQSILVLRLVFEVSLWWGWMMMVDLGMWWSLRGLMMIKRVLWRIQKQMFELDLLV